MIEDVAARLFAQNGYEATRLDDIAAAAQVTKPIVYRHFASKQALFMALLAKYRDALAVAAVTPFVENPDAPFVERMAAGIDAWYAYVEEHPCVGPLLFRASTSDPAILAALNEQYARQRAADIALFREAGIDGPDAELEPLAEVVRSSLTGLALWWTDHPDVPRSVVVNTMMRVLTPLLAPST